MPERSVILHIQRHAYYGAAENAFTTISRDMPQYSHVFVELDPPVEKDRFYLKSSTDISARSGMHVAYCGRVLSFRNVKYAIYYDVPRDYADARVEHDGKPFVWDFGSLDTFDKSCVKGEDLLYPMIDTDRIASITGRVTKPTVGITYDPNVPGFNMDTAFTVMRSLDSRHRAIITRPDCLYSSTVINPEDYECEVVQRPFTVGFDWQYQSLCSVIVSDYSLNPGRYGYMCATAMAMGKLLICDKSGAYSSYSRNRVSAIHFDDPEDIVKYIYWSENNRSQADRIRAAAQYHSYIQDRDPNMYKLACILEGL